jgi:hypothetical protein
MRTRAECLQDRAERRGHHGDGHPGRASGSSQVHSRSREARFRGGRSTRTASFFIKRGTKRFRRSWKGWWQTSSSSSRTAYSCSHTRDVHRSARKLRSTAPARCCAHLATQIRGLLAGQCVSRRQRRADIWHARFQALPTRTLLPRPRSLVLRRRGSRGLPRASALFSQSARHRPATPCVGTSRRCPFSCSFGASRVGSTTPTSSTSENIDCACAARHRHAGDHGP